MDDTQNNTTNDALIKLESLQKEYEVILQQYQESVNTYISTLENTSTATSTQYTALRGRTWWGTQGLAEGIVNTQAECESMCANAKLCSGATFNPVKHYCWARGGNSRLTPGQDEDYALIPQQKAALIVMKELNDKLMSLSEQIIAQIKIVEPAIESQKQDQQNNQQSLNSTYQQLLKQKWEMEKQLQEYNSIEEDYENQDLYATQATAGYRFWTVLMVLIVIITLKKMYGSESVSINMLFWLLMTILLILLTFNLSQPAGFLTWGVVLMIIILMRTGNLPTV